MLRLTALTCLLLACGGSSRNQPAPPAAGDNGAPELQVLDRFRTLDDQVEQSRGQCEKLATSVDAWLDESSAEVGALIERSRAEPGLAGDELAQVEDDLGRIFDRLLDALGSCRGRGSVDRVTARLDAWLEAS